MFYLQDYIGELYNAVQDTLGAPCAILLMLLLPILTPVAVVVELDASDFKAGIKRGLKVVGLFAAAALLCCVASLAKNIMFDAFLGGFGIGVIHVVLLGTVLLLGRTGK